VRVAIVGCGFLGSLLAEELGRASFSQVIPVNASCWDGDVWETRNAAHQNVSLIQAAKGGSKAETAANWLKAYGVGAKWEANRVEEDNVRKLFLEHDLVFDGVDEIQSRQRLWQHSLVGAPCIHVGIDRNGNGRVDWSSRVFDNFPLAPTRMLRPLPDDDVEEPPCDLYRHRITGLMAVQAAIRAFCLFAGRDPWGIFDGISIPGVMTSWFVGSIGMELRSDPTDMDGDTPPMLPIDQLPEDLR